MSRTESHVEYVAREMEQGIKAARGCGLLLVILSLLGLFWLIYQYLKIA